MPGRYAPMSEWNETTLTSFSDVTECLLELRGRAWLCRGQSQAFGSLIPSIDRCHRDLSRHEKLLLERRGIDLWCSSARFFSHEGERLAIGDDLTALMVLRHYGIPTRLLDWTLSPWVAAYFAVNQDDEEDGELWAFDHVNQYKQKGEEQWQRWPETTRDGTGNPDQFDAKLTAFSSDDPPDWFICGFYHPGFPRQLAQKGAFTMTARFSRDHAEAIAALLQKHSTFHRYVIKSSLKSDIRRALRDRHGIWRGSLYPDSAGAADTVRHEIFPEGA